MNKKNKYIKTSALRAIRSLLKISMVLACILWFIQSGSLKAQVISNNGAGISITNGTFVNTDSVQNTVGKITNNGIFDLSGTYINEDTTQGNGIFNIGGDWTNTNIFTPGISTVRFNGTNFQTITSTGGETFYHVVINNTGAALTNRIILIDDVIVSDTLNFTSGNVETGANKLYLSDQTIGSLKYNSVTGSRVIGKFERGINSTSSNYLFPIGSVDNYNPMNLNFNTIQSTGSVLSEFVSSDPDSIGLPLPDPGYVNPSDTVEVYDADSAGYWSVTANGFVSDDFDVNLDGTGFDAPYQNATRIIKRLDGGDWTLDGKHKDAIGSITSRNTLIGGIDNSPGHHFGWGKIRPRIQTQPEDTAICDGFSATFSVVATGRGELTYDWEVHEGSGGWQPITDDAIYSNSNTDTLLLISADTSMDGYKYRVIITDSLGNFKRSNSQATLTVNPNPIAIATPQKDTICNGNTTHIELNSTVPGTTFSVVVLNLPTDIIGTLATLDGDTIKDNLTNPNTYADSVVYVITPTGPGFTSCVGTIDTVIIWVEPTVTISALDDTICDNTPTLLRVTSANITTNGMRYTWTVTPNANIIGEANSDAVGLNMGSIITQILDNTSTDAQMVTYTITPWTIDANGNNTCSGISIDIDIWVEPTVQITAVNDTICDDANTNILITSIFTTTNGIRYTWSVVDNPNINNETNSIGNGQFIGTPIVQALDNISDSKQLVQYVITPWTVNASNENECTNAGEVITIDIWIEPTPRVIATILDDTICNDTRTHITLTTPSVLTNGNVTFDYTSIEDAGLTGNSGPLFNLTDSYIIEDLLNNSTTGPAIPQVVRYAITPRAITTGCANGLIITDSITVHPTADTYFINVDSVRCYLESNGSATVVAENGVGIFTYEWDDPLNQNDAIVTGLVEGFYTVTVTDNQSCTKTDAIAIEQPDLLIPVIDTIKAVSCFGKGDGYIVLNPTGGNGTYSYLWSNEEKNDTISGLDGAIYYATVTDWKGCAQDTSMEVDEPPQVSIDIFTEHVRCNGENNGSAEINAIGLGTYIWTTNETTAKISNLAPGNYTVTATNAEGCESIQTTTITEPDSLLVDSIISTRISCEGDADGTINLFVSGGNTIIPYTYNWFTTYGTGLVPEDSTKQTGLSGGVYYVTVNDWMGCEINDSAYINEPPVYTSSISVNHVMCFDDGDGIIDLTVDGGNIEDPYSYYWITPDGVGLDANSEDQSGLSGGSYYVTVTDAKDCELYDTAIVYEPDLLETFITETNVSCFGYDDGTAKLDISGGSGGYIINWNPPNGATSDSIYGLSAGTYNVEVKDINECITTNYVEITEPEQIENNVIFSNITCFGYNNGEILITPTGGILPYSYLWSHSAVFTDSLADNLNPGNYSISVIDNNNCIEVTNVDITQPDPLIIEVTKEDITCFGMEDGYISLSMFGGTPEYTYNWLDGYEETSADMLPQGLYNINISDIHNCELDTTIRINEPDKLMLNPILRLPTCADIQDGSLELNITGGRLPYSIYWSDGSFEENLYEIRSGIYDVVINDSSLCEIDTSFVVRSAHDFCIEIPSAFTPNADNINERWEIDMKGLYPNAEIEIFDRLGKRIFFSTGYEESQYWDGTLKGKKLPMDTYYYIIYLKNGSRRISGTVILIR